jgi:hypothetical protein
MFIIETWEIEKIQRNSLFLYANFLFNMENFKYTQK